MIKVMVASCEAKTFQEAIIYFVTPANCREYLLAHRWPGGVICPRCGGTRVLFQEKYNRWQCGAKHPRRQFTFKTGTIFEDSPLGLDKWLLAMWQVVNCKNGVSSYEVAREIGVTQKSAWFMDHRIRVALAMATLDKLSVRIEAGETLVVAKARNVRDEQHAPRFTVAGNKDKTAVIGILESSKDDKHGKHGKHSTVQTTMIPNRKKRALQADVRKRVGATLIAG